MREDDDIGIERRNRITVEPRPPRDPLGVRATMIRLVLSLVCAAVGGLLAPASGGTSARLVNAGPSFAAGVQRAAGIRTARVPGTHEAVRAPADSQLFRAWRRTAHRIRLIANPCTVLREPRARAEYYATARPQGCAGRPSLAFQAHAPPA